MNITELPSLLKQLEDRAGEQAALKALLAELGQALAELLEQNESAGAALAKAIADALKGVRIAAPKVEVAAPTVHVAAPEVTVQAPSVTVNPQINLPADKKGKGCDIEFTYGHGGLITGAKVRHL